MKKHYKWQTPRSKTSIERILIERISAGLERAETVYDVEILCWRIVDWGIRIEKGFKAVQPRLKADLKMVERARAKR